jgi:hypothetical protein
MSALLEVNPSLLRIGFQNVNGMSGKCEYLSRVMEETNMDIMFIVETWLKPVISTNLLARDTFLDIRQNSAGRRGKGGIVGLCKSHSIKKTITTLEEDKEGMYAIVRINDFHLAIGYFSPDEQYTPKMKLFMEKAMALPEVLIMADFNAHNVNWGSPYNNARGIWLENNMEGRLYSYLLFFHRYQSCQTDF